MRRAGADAGTLTAHQARDTCVRDRNAVAVRAAVSFAASLIVPPRCVACEAPTHPREHLCAGCEAWLRASRPLPGAVRGADATWSAASYAGPARGLVAALKFGRLLPLARRAASAIVEATPPGLLDGAVVPVPPAPLRLRSRGFDAAEEIALELARLSGLPFAACLRRCGGPRQVGRPRSERLTSPPRVVARGPAPRDAILVDDVLTTGATLAACAAALREAGAERVVALTFASSERMSGPRPRAPG